jgi:hypothetical protein
MELTITESDLKKIECNRMTATLICPICLYESNIEPHTIQFKFCKYEVIAVKNATLTLDIKSSEKENASSMMDVLLYIMNIVQLAEGYFLDVNEVEWSNDVESVCKLSKCEYEKVFLHFHTNKEYIRNELVLLPMFDVFNMIDDTTYNNYQQLKNDLCIQLNLFRLVCSDKVPFVDLRCAFFIELLEPLAVYEGFVSDNEPLKQSISSFILYHGQELFRTECNNGLKFISLMVKSRVGVMHAKLARKKKQGLTMDQCAFYNLKLQLLFRSYFLNKLGIVISPYKLNLEKAIKYAEKPTKNGDLKSSF